MVQEKIVIKHKFLGLNKVINAERSNRFAAAKIKKEETRVAELASKGFSFTDYPVDVVFTWHVKKNRGKYQDPDNIAASCKQIFDGLQASGALKDDTHKCIKSIHHNFVWESEEDFVEITG